MSSIGDDGRVPSVTEVTLTPDVATLGGVFELTLATDEPLARSPDATLGDGGHFTVSATDASMQRFTLRYDVRGTEAPGQQPINVTLVDGYGNEAHVVAATAQLDFIAPRLGLALWTLPGAKRAVKPGDTVSLIANVDTDAMLEGAMLYADTTAIADVTEAFLVAAADDGSGLQLRGELAIPSTGLADDALLAVGFVLSDAAGNATNPQAALSPALPVDAKPPQGTLTLPNASESSSITASLTTDDAISVRFEGDIQSPVGAQSPVPTTLTLLVTGGNGIKTISAIFEDAAGNSTTTAPETINVDVPPGAGSPGLPCAVATDCNSLTCACADATCQQRRCAASSSCGPCNYVNGAGACVGTLDNEVQDAGGCSGTRVCGSGGVCLTARGQACTLPTDCVSAACECRDAGCTGKICANADCDACHAGANCGALRSDDTVCDTGRVCRVGSCVVRNPGTCTAYCSGNLTCLGPEITDDNCNHTQGFAPSFTGFCPGAPPCRGTPSCGCY